MHDIKKCCTEKFTKFLCKAFEYDPNSSTCNGDGSGMESGEYM